MTGPCFYAKTAAFFPFLLKVISLRNGNIKI